jgi:hypothetical protein
VTGLNDTDIRLNDVWQLTRAANGDAPLCSGLDCLYQNIALEAVTQKGDVFYDLDFGWSLYDFIQSEDDDLTRLEIAQRARTGLQKRDVILAETIGINIDYGDDKFHLYCTFRFTGETDDRQLNVVIDAVSVEVVNSD